MKHNTDNRKMEAELGQRMGEPSYIALDLDSKENAIKHLHKLQRRLVVAQACRAEGGARAQNRRERSGGKGRERSRGSKGL